MIPQTPLPEPLRLDAADLDAGIDPRIDLDGHVNARWRANARLPEDRSCWDSFAVLEQRSLLIQAQLAGRAASGQLTGDAARVVGALWASGLASSGLDGLQPELALIDGLGDGAAVGTYLCDRHARGWPVLFDLDVLPAHDQPQAHLACITPAPLGLPAAGLYQEVSTRAAQIRAAYVEYIAQALALTGVSSVEAPPLASAVLQLEATLAGALPQAQPWQRDIRLHQRRIGIETADAGGGLLRWRTYFDALGESALAQFSLAVPAYEAAVQSALHRAPPAAWRAYLRFQALDSLADSLDDTAAAARHRFRSGCLRGQSALRPRWKRVLEAIHVHAGEALGQLYAGQELAVGTLSTVHDIAARLRQAFEQRLRNLDWMTTSTRQEALRKLARLRFKIGAPPQPRDWSDCAVSSGDWYGNLAALRAFGLRHRLKKLPVAVDREEWTLFPQTVNARYDPQRNDVTLPAALLHAPFFDPAAPLPVNLGGIGAVLAHEMTHGYDERGRCFDAEGRLHDWWGEADARQFHARAAALARHVESLPFAGGRVDGLLTLAENIADFGGLAIACTALRQWLAEQPEAAGGPDPLQRFFMNWAALWRQKLSSEEAELRLRVDPHAPAPLRARAAALDLAEFAAAFGATGHQPGVAAAPRPIGLW